MLKYVSYKEDLIYVFFCVLYALIHVIAETSINIKHIVVMAIADILMKVWRGCINHQASNEVLRKVSIPPV